MVASVRIERKAFTDIRIDVLGDLAGYNRHEALGRLALAWGTCTEENAHVLPEVVVRQIFGQKGVDALLGSGLGRKKKHGIYIAGAKGRIEWLENKRLNGRLGGRPKQTDKEPLGLQADDRRKPTPNPPAPAPAPAPSSSSSSSSSPDASRLISAQVLSDSLHQWSGWRVGGFPPRHWPRLLEHGPYSDLEVRYARSLVESKPKSDWSAGLLLRIVLDERKRQAVGVSGRGEYRTAQRSVFRDVTEQALQEAREYDQGKLREDHDRPAGALPAKGG